MPLPSTELNKKRAILLSMTTALGLTLLKATAALWGNSLALFASALDSLLDLFSSSINYLSIRIADRPADEDHPFGHGKAEGLAGLFQSLFIALSSLFLIQASVKRLLRAEPLQEVPLGIGVMVVSMIATIFLVRRLRRVSKETESLTLRSDALHYATDLATNAGIILSLLLIRWTGWLPLDPIVSLLVTLSILWAAGRLLKDSLDELMDRALPAPYRQEVENILKQYEPHLFGCHDFRSRRSGSRKLIEFHVEVDRSRSFEEAHELAESLRLAVENRIQNSHVTIHYDPAGYQDRKATVEQRLK